MTNKSTLQKVFSVKATVTVILLILVAGGIYTTIHKKSTPTDSANQAEKSLDSEALAVKSSGLDINQAVKTVGDVENVIAKWVEANPEAIIQSVVSMQRKAAEQQQQNAQQNISTKTKEIFNQKDSPTYSPKGSNVTIVEFFDYSCGYCKKAQSSVEALVKKDKKVKIVFKELPILGQSSLDLATVSIAVNIVNPDKYFSFHNSLMKSAARSTEDAITVAKSLGVDETKLRNTIKNKKSDIDSQIKSNQELAGSIGINGTPAFIIGEELIPGAVDVSTLEAKVSAQRAK